MARILLADDEEDVAIIVNEYLKPHGHEVSWATDGGVAWEMFQKNNYDLVILDLRIPVLDGYAICKKIKESKKPYVPVLFLSGHINEKGFHDKNICSGQNSNISKYGLYSGKQISHKAKR